MTAERLFFDRASLLAEASRRVRSRGEVRRAIERGGKVAAGVEACLAEALDCVEALCAPAAALKQVEAAAATGGVRLAGGVLQDRRLGERLSTGGRIFVYLLTCGYDSRDAFARLGGDYAVNHFQNLIGRELLFSIGRALYRQASERAPELRFSRHPIMATGQEDGTGSPQASARWDAGRVRSLLELFGDGTLGVSATEAGCFAPLHSLLGLMTALPVASAD